jgi:signal transduction histidine kinase
VAEVRDYLWLLLERPGAAQALGLVKDEPDDAARSAATHLTSGVARELENLLFVIGARAELLMEALPAQNPRREDLDNIIGGTKRATALLHRSGGPAQADSPLSDG